METIFDREQLIQSYSYHSILLKSVEKGTDLLCCIYCCSLDEIEVGYGTCQEMRG
jgi:hypothetical protein